jgi:mevalonate kinase
MMWSHFSTRVPGKWVLAGEHSVLRGATAVAIPHEEVGLTLSFDPEVKDLGFAVEPTEAQPLIGELLASIADAWESDGKMFPKPLGRLKIQSNIPIGAGLGSSAALCVALTRWMADPLTIPGEQLTEFSTQLEHRFHGRSSGMDVAVIAAGEPISFAMGRGVRSIGIKRLPRFTFHDTGLRGRTSECVLRVEKFREETPALGVKVDEAMGTASRLAMEGLIQYDAGHFDQGQKLVQEAMKIGRECFYSWELVPGEARRLEEKLLGEGALAVKLTGAGGGGIIVALWPEDHPRVT